MKKFYLYGVCVFFLFLLQIVPMPSFAESASGTTTAEVTFTQGPIENDGGDDGNKADDPGGKNNGNDLKDKINDFIDKKLPNTGEQRKLYLMIIGACLISIAYVVFQTRRKKIESGKNE